VNPWWSCGRRCATAPAGEFSRPGGSKPAWLAAPGQSRGAYWIERNGQSRSSQARPDAAAIIQGAVQAHAVGSAERIVQLISSRLAAALGEKRARELRARGADMDWDQAIAYTLTQTTQAISELELQTQL
jgi:hypothetical protein